MLKKEKLGWPNFLAPGNRSHKKSSDDVSRRLESSTGNAVSKKRVRTPVVEIEAEGRGSGTFGQPAMFSDKDVLNDRVDGSGLVEGKICKLPPGGEGWDRKIRRKCSVDNVSSKSSDDDGSTRRVVLNKLHLSEISHSHSFRLKSSADHRGIKVGDNSLPRSNARVLPKNESEKVSLSKINPGFNEEKLRAKRNKLNVHEDSHINNSSSSRKLSGTRGERNGLVAAANLTPHSSGTLECGKRPPDAKIPQSFSGAKYNKGAFPTGSSSSMAQWVGQRPQKSRNRRTNLVSPILNQDELQVSSEGRYAAADLDSKLTSGGTSSTSIEKGVDCSPYNLKLRADPSPTGLYDNDDLDDGLNEKEKNNGEVEEMCTNSIQIISPSPTLAKRKNILNKVDNVDGVLRQGRSSALSFPKVSTPAINDKLNSPSSTKPSRCPKPTTRKNKSKFRRSAVENPVGQKVDSIRRTSLGDPVEEFTGELDDDHEELLAAADFARNASYLACSSPFYRKMERVFASLSLVDMHYLKQQLSSPAKLPESKSQIGRSDTCASGRLAQIVWNLSGNLVLSSGGQKQQDQNEVNKSTSLVDPIQDARYGLRRVDSVGGKPITPLYQRVLSALIIEDELEECGLNNDAGGKTPLQYCSDSSPAAASSYAMYGYQCFQSDSSMFEKKFQHKFHKDNSTKGHNGLMDSHLRSLPETLKNGVNETISVQNSAVSCITLPDYEYGCTDMEERLLLELQTLGLCPDYVPELADEEDEAINQEIIELQRELKQQAGKKAPYLTKIIEEVQKWKVSEEGALERIALDRLVELAYQKKLATNGRIATRLGLHKVSKEVSAGFTKRTLARCQKYEEMGKSDFTEPALRDVLLAPLCITDADTMDSIDLRNADISEGYFAKSGPILNKGGEKEVSLDNSRGNMSLQAASNLHNSLLNGAKGKRSARGRTKFSSENGVMKAGRSEHKTKSKPKQKLAGLPICENGFIRYSEAHPPCDIGNACDKASNKIRDVKESLGQGQPNKELHESDPVADLGVDNGLGGNKDLGTTLNMDDEIRNVKEPLGQPNTKVHESDADLGVDNGLGGNEDLGTTLNMDDEIKEVKEPLRQPNAKMHESDLGLGVDFLDFDDSLLEVGMDDLHTMIFDIPMDDLSDVPIDDLLDIPMDDLSKIPMDDLMFL